MCLAVTKPPAYSSPTTAITCFCALQFWDSVSTGIKPTQQGLTLQLNTSAGAVLPGEPLGTLLTVPGSSDPSGLTKNKRLLAEAQALLKGAKVSLSSQVVLTRQTIAAPYSSRVCTVLQSNPLWKPRPVGSNNLGLHYFLSNDQ
jgi:hypothetical protein